MDNIFAKNVRQYRENLGISQIEFAKLLGVSSQSVSTWEVGSNSPRMKMLPKIAQILGVSVIDLMTDSSSRDELTTIPIIGSVAAGVPIEESQDIDGYAEVSGDTRNTYALRVHGDSMYPEFHDGDTVIIKKQSSYKNGDIVVARVNGYEYTVKKYRRNNNDVLLIPVNSDFEPMVYDESVIAIEGRVVEARRKY